MEVQSQLVLDRAGWWACDESRTSWGQAGASLVHGHVRPNGLLRSALNWGHATWRWEVGSSTPGKACFPAYPFPTQKRPPSRRRCGANPTASISSADAALVWESWMVSSRQRSVRRTNASSFCWPEVADWIAPWELLPALQ